MACALTCGFVLRTLRRSFSYQDALQGPCQVQELLCAPGLPSPVTERHALESMGSRAGLPVVLHGGYDCEVKADYRKSGGKEFLKSAKLRLRIEENIVVVWGEGGNTAGAGMLPGRDWRQ